MALLIGWRQLPPPFHRLVVVKHSKVPWGAVAVRWFPHLRRNSLLRLISRTNASAFANIPTRAKMVMAKPGTALAFPRSNGGGADRQQKRDVTEARLPQKSVYPPETKQEWALMSTRKKDRKQASRGRVRDTMRKGDGAMAGCRGGPGAQPYAALSIEPEGRKKSSKQRRALPRKEHSFERVLSARLLIVWPSSAAPPPSPPLSGLSRSAAAGSDEKRACQDLR